MTQSGGDQSSHDFKSDYLVKMEIFRNYITRHDKKLTMEDSWSKVCCRWANSLDFADVKDLISLIDG